MNHLMNVSPEQLIEFIGNHWMMGAALFVVTILLVLLVGRNVTGSFAPDIDGLLILAALSLHVAGVAVVLLAIRR